ncbi:MAG: hypothetical protein IT561_12865, partial [Alphaproteobacteria bacterium]|nr:hypothetical protein [Alphaproteobacteria bacterium]
MASLRKLRMPSSFRDDGRARHAAQAPRAAATEPIGAADALERAVDGLQSGGARRGIGVLSVSRAASSRPRCGASRRRGTGYAASLRTYHAVEIAERVAAGDVDVGATLDPAADGRLTADLLAETPARREGELPDDFAGERLVLPPAPSIGRGVAEAAFARARVALDAAREAPGPALCDLVVDGPAVAIVSPLAVWRYRAHGVVARRFMHHAPGRFFLLRRKGMPLRACQTALEAQLIAMFEIVGRDLALAPGAMPGGTRRASGFLGGGGDDPDPGGQPAGRAFVGPQLGPGTFGRAGLATG